MNGQKLNEILNEFANLVRPLWPQGRQKSPMEFTYEALQNDIRKPESLKFLSVETVTENEVPNHLIGDFICCLRGEINSEDMYTFSLPVEWIEDIEDKTIYSDMWSIHEKNTNLNTAGAIMMTNLKKKNLQIFTPCSMENLKKVIPPGRRLRFQCFNYIKLFEGVGHFFYEF